MTGFMPFIKPNDRPVDQQAQAQVAAEFRTNIDAQITIQLERNATVMGRLETLLEQLAKSEPPQQQRVYFLTVGGDNLQQPGFALPTGESWHVARVQLVALANVTGNPVVTIDGLYPVAIPLQATLNIPTTLEVRYAVSNEQHLDLRIDGGAGTVMVVITWDTKE